MKYLRQLLAGALVLVPTLAAFLVNLSPLPLGYLDANRSRSQAARQNDAPTELGALENLLRYTPWRGDLWLRLGRLQLNRGAFTDAVYAFEQAEYFDALTFEGRVWQADALISVGQLAEARDLLRPFSTFVAVDGFTLLQAALLQRRINDPYGALATLLKGVEVDPLNSEINFQAGLQLSAVDPDQAVHFLDEAAKLNPNRQAISTRLIEIIRLSQEMPDKAARFILIGQTLSNLNEWDVAQRAFQNAVNLDGENGVAWALLAEAAQQNKQDGRIFIVKALELAPGSELVNGLYALYLRRQGKPEIAIPYLEQALEINPLALVWEIEMGNTLAEMGDIEGALRHYQQATRVDPQDWTPWRALAVFSITRNYQVGEIGLPAATQALALYPSSPALMDLLGTGFMLEGDYDSAEIYFLQANAIDPNQSPILIHLGQLYLALEKNDLAYDYLKQAIVFARDNRLIEMANRILLENGEPQ